MHGVIINLEMKVINDGQDLLCQQTLTLHRPSHNTHTTLTGYRRCEAQFVSDEEDACYNANIDLVSVWGNIPVFTKVGE